MTTWQDAIDERSGGAYTGAPSVSPAAAMVEGLCVSASYGLERTAATVIVPWAGNVAGEDVEPIVAGPKSRRPIRIKIAGVRRVTSAKYSEPAYDE